MELHRLPSRQYTVRTQVQAVADSAASGQASLALAVGQRPAGPPAPISPPSRAGQGAPWDHDPSDSGVAPSGPFAPEPSGSSPQLPVAQARRWHLMLNFDTGQREQVAAGTSFNLGRRPEATEDGDQLVAVRDPDSTVSKTHLRVEYRSGALWLLDHGSTNGSEVFDEDGNGTTLQAGERVMLEEGSRVRIGHRSFTVAIVEAD